ncbi:MAG TPA: hypothetical protein VFP35_02700 [Candidatus Saccharimonadales bacterium]|nr:hypothetical protein [Candidatus Saccharimonadales bacterium]
MSWSWSSPIALGLFLLMCGGTAVLVGIGISAAASSARWVAELPVVGSRRRR